MVDIFIDYCMNCNIAGIKSMSLKDCNLYEGFIFACMRGHYDVVKYLVELYKNDPNYKKINIHSNNEDGFNWACEHGHYNIVKYLVELHMNDKNYKKINIHCYDEEGFILACENRHYDIVKYLMKLYKNHKYTYEPFNNYLMIFDKFHKYKL